LIEEKHIPIIHEQHTHSTDKERKDVVVTEVFEKAIVDKHVEKPVVTEIVEKTIVETDIDQHLHGSGSHKHSAGLVETGAAGGVHSTEYMKETVDVSGGAQGHG
jgi:hypothetical protein